jgi:hypothetical protein
MPSLLHRTAIMSIGLIVGLSAVASAAPAARSPYYGRWTVNEDRPVYTAKGRAYKTIDIAPCGNDFCGVSVADNGTCGATLFRFLASHADGETMLQGKGKWGTERKNVQIEFYQLEASDWPGGRELDLYLGDGHDFGGRSESMPRFHGEYKRLGEARCKAR